MLRHTSIASILCTALLVCQLLVPASSEAEDLSYSIVLASAPGTNHKWAPRKNPLFDGRTIYTHQAKIKGKTWERLYLGYFADRKQAAALLVEIQQFYPGAWIQKTQTGKIKSTVKKASATTSASKRPLTAIKPARKEKRSGTTDLSKTYSIILSSSSGRNINWKPRKTPLFDGRSIYVSQTTIKGAPWERLCLGYFPKRRQAVALLKNIQKIYPGAWVQRTSVKNITSTLRKSSATPTLSKQPLKAKKSKLTDKQLDSLMERAKSDLTNKKLTSAIRFLTALINAGDHKYSREALELLGLARQRKGQKSHAVNVYEKYLGIYPDGEGSDRVRQRLAGLLTSARGPRGEIAMSTLEIEEEITTYGSLSQTYRRNEAQADGSDKVTTVSQIISFLDLTTLQTGANFDQRYQFTFDHTYDFISGANPHEYRFIETYYEIAARKSGSSARIGRQALRIGGILKRFDGLSAGYQITPDVRLNLLGGFPVGIDEKTSVNRDKNFYGMTFETGIFLEHWELNPFYFKQTVDGLVDRESLGTELHYRDRNKAIFGMIDYDTFYKEIDIIQVNANLLLDQGRTAYMNAFLRKAPILATSNALIGQPERTIEELKKNPNLNIEQIYQLARNRTANSQTITVGGSQPIGENFQAATDITVARVGDTVADNISGVAVPESPGTGADYFLSAQIVGNNLLVERDTGVLGVRYFDTSPSNTVSLIANSRFPLTRNWRINPRMQYDIRKSKNGGSQKKLRFIFRTDYRYLNQVRFDFEVGYDETNNESNGQSLGANNLFYTLGYRWDF